MAEAVSTPPPARVAESYKRLAASAEVLNAKSDAFTKEVGVLDDALKKLNLGVTAWERIRGSDDDGHGNYWSEDVGYAKVWGKWCIAIRERSGNHNTGDHENDEWPFADSPREMRISAIDQIPDLLDKLCKYADKTARKIDEKTAQTKELSAALAAAAAEVEQRQGKKGGR
jgi:hypothetical protein